MKRIWAGVGNGPGAIGPPPAREGGPEILVGGHADASMRRAARFGDGWIMGGVPADLFAGFATKLDEAWATEGRSGKPHKAALAYFSLGASAREGAHSYIHDYYGRLGEYANQIVAGVAVSDDMVGAQVHAFERAGCDELFFIPCSKEIEQVGLLAEALGK